MAYIHKPNSHNWYYCVEADNPILPSQVPDELRCNWLSYSVGKLWVETYKSAEDYAGLMETTVGKWTIFPEGGNVDGLWPKLLGATATGILEVEIKASTSYRKGKKLICVYTYDELDKEDTDRVYDALRALNIGGWLSYKADWMTYMGIHASTWTAAPGERPRRSKSYWNYKELIDRHNARRNVIVDEFGRHHSLQF